MRYLSKDYVQSEILDTISLMQLNKEYVPILSSTEIEFLSEKFIEIWTEIGDWEANFEQMLVEFLREEFTNG